MRPPYDRAGIYAIHIDGRLEQARSERLGGLTMTTVEEDDNGRPVTILIGCLPDQAALLGILNTLYNMRYAILFVRYLRPSEPS